MFLNYDRFLNSLRSSPNVRKTVVPFSGKKPTSITVAMNEAGIPSVFTKKQRVKTIVFKLPVNLKTNISINGGAITYKPPPISDSILYLDINLVPKDWNTVSASKWIFHAV